MAGSMDDILALDRSAFLAVEVVEAGPFAIALLPGGRVVWRVPTDSAGTAPYLIACDQIVVVTDDSAVFHRRVAEEAGML